MGCGNMRDYMSIGPSPCEEDCAQLGSEGYYERMKEETKRYKEQLERRFPNLPEGVRFVVKAFEHDFGTYHEVCVVYDDSKEDQVKAAYFIEGNSPATWNDTEILKWRK